MLTWKGRRHKTAAQDSWPDERPKGPRALRAEADVEGQALRAEASGVGVGGRRRERCGVRACGLAPLGHELGRLH